MTCKGCGGSSPPSGTHDPHTLAGVGVLYFQGRDSRPCSALWPVWGSCISRGRDFRPCSALWPVWGFCTSRGATPGPALRFGRCGGLVLPGGATSRPCSALWPVWGSCISRGRDSRPCSALWPVWGFCTSRGRDPQDPALRFGRCGGVSSPTTGGRGRPVSPRGPGSRRSANLRGATRSVLHCRR